MQQRPSDASGHSSLVIAIDGPSGSGKSTVARAVARRLGLRYLDTGALYRAVTWAVLRDDPQLEHPERWPQLATEADIRATTEPERHLVHVGSTDITTDIRSNAVTDAVSAVSAVAAVRAVLLEWQRRLIGAGGIVVEGRDIGTTVAPDAPVKVFLTADPNARAARRSRETAADVAATADALHRRDAADSGRATSPLTAAADAVHIDSTDLDVDQVVDRVLAAVRSVPS